MSSSQARTQDLLQTSKMESFAAIVNSVQSLTFIAKLSILDIFGGLGYGFAIIRQQLVQYPKKHWNNMEC